NRVVARERDLDVVPVLVEDFRLSASAAFYDSELKDDYCNFSAGVCTSVLAPAGTRLPVTADIKYNVVGRYHWEAGTLDAYFQGALVHEGDRDSDLDQAANAILGTLPSYTTLDLSGGFGRDNWMVDVFVSNITGEDAPIYFNAQCVAETCGDQVYGVRIRPTTITARFTWDFD
ncbi:MAG: TonB-dependent receptor, partial [Pseudomonadota bacterium]